MVSRHAHSLFVVLTALLCLGIPRGYSATLPADNLYLACLPGASAARLECEYRLRTSEPVIAVTAQANGLDIPVSSIEAYPWKEAITAILFLVDTSDPARQPVIEQNKKHIALLLSAAKPHHRTGLASFDKSLRNEVAVGMAGENIIQAAGQLRATGMTTELYRSVLSAIDNLRTLKADRKTIFLFSDGLAEDRAYYHDDVVSAAKQAGIVITGLGYPRSVSQSVALQTLMRLSEETGGVFVDTGNDFNLPGNFIENPYSNIDNGGRFSIDIPASVISGKTGKGTVRLSLETASGDYTLDVPLPGTAQQPRTVTPDIAVNPAATPVSPPALQTIQVITKAAPESSSNIWLWYGVPAVLILILVIILVTFSVTFFRQEKKSSTRTGGSTEFKPYAYLIMQDETKKRYPITRTMWRIGRGKDNEMTIADSSISRRHAEISRDKGDVFTLMDLDSLNGVYVNNHKISHHILHEGDIIEIGDIHLRFSLLSADYAIEDATAMQNTRAPFTH